MKQLAIQEYLRSGKTLTDLKQEYHIDSIVNNELGVVVFNYTPLTPLNTEIGKEARALFLQLKKLLDVLPLKKGFHLLQLVAKFLQL